MEPIIIVVDGAIGAGKSLLLDKKPLPEDFQLAGRNIKVRYVYKNIEDWEAYKVYRDEDDDDDSWGQKAKYARFSNKRKQGSDEDEEENMEIGGIDDERQQQFITVDLTDPNGMGFFARNYAIYESFTEHLKKAKEEVKALCSRNEDADDIPVLIVEGGLTACRQLMEWSWRGRLTGKNRRDWMDLLEKTDKTFLWCPHVTFLLDTPVDDCVDRTDPEFAGRTKEIWGFYRKKIDSTENKDLILHPAESEKHTEIFKKELEKAIKKGLEASAQDPIVIAVEGPIGAGKSLLLDKDPLPEDLEMAGRHLKIKYVHKNVEDWKHYRYDQHGNGEGKYVNLTYSDRTNCFTRHSAIYKSFANHLQKAKEEVQARCNHEHHLPVLIVEGGLTAFRRVIEIDWEANRMTPKEYKKLQDMIREIDKTMFYWRPDMTLFLDAPLQDCLDRINTDDCGVLTCAREVWSHYKRMTIDKEFVLRPEQNHTEILEKALEKIVKGLEPPSLVEPAPITPSPIIMVVDGPIGAGKSRLLRESPIPFDFFQVAGHNIKVNYVQKNTKEWKKYKYYTNIVGKRRPGGHRQQSIVENPFPTHYIVYKSFAQHLQNAVKEVQARCTNPEDIPVLVVEGGLTSCRQLFALDWENNRITSEDYDKMQDLYEEISKVFDWHPHVTFYLNTRFQECLDRVKKHAAEDRAEEQETEGEGADINIDIDDIKVKKIWNHYQRMIGRADDHLVLDPTIRYHVRTFEKELVEIVQRRVGPPEPIIIVVDGAIGAGKSYLLDQKPLPENEFKVDGRNIRVNYVKENVEDWINYKMNEKDKPINLLELKCAYGRQYGIYRSFTKHLEKAKEEVRARCIEQNDVPVLIVERGLIASQHLSEVDLKEFRICLADYYRLQNLYKETAERFTWRPDVTFYLSTPLSVCINQALYVPEERVTEVWKHYDELIHQPGNSQWVLDPQKYNGPIFMRELQRLVKTWNRPGLVPID